MQIIVPAGTSSDTWLAEDPTNNAMLLKHVAECALASGRDFWVNWNGQIVAQTKGALGLGQNWIDGGPFDRIQQERVRSCLLARVNSAGAHVNLDLLAGFAPSAGQPALNTAAAYSSDDMAFYGNMFGSNAELYACYLGDQYSGDTNAPLQTPWSCNGTDAQRWLMR